MRHVYDDDDAFSAREQKLALLEDEHQEVSEDSDIFGHDELEHADAVLSSGVGDSLTQKASLRQDKWQELNNVANFRRINPPSVLQGVIGGQQPIELTVDNYRNPPRPEVANWGGDDSETLPVTVVFAPVQQVQNAIQQVELQPIGIVQFGTRGMAVRAEVDIGTGVQFTINASSVILQVTLETDPNFVFPPGNNTLATARLSGMLSFYTTTHTNSITRTKLVYPSAGPVATNVVVPPFSRNVYICRSTTATNPTGAALTLDFKNSQGFTVHTRFLAAGAYIDEPIPLGNSVVSIDVTYTGGGFSGPVVSLIFGLAF